VTVMAITASANTDLATRQYLERFKESIVSRIELQLATSLGELRTEMVRGDGELRQQIARSANSTLRWVLATVLLAQGGTIGYLNLMLR